MQRTQRTLFPIIALIAAAVQPVRAADITWDTSTSAGVTGGAGTWDTTTTNWTANAGTSNLAWVNANNDTAIFGGTAGTATLTIGITIGGATFNTNGYRVTGDTLTFGGATTTFSVAAASTATIASATTGSATMVINGVDATSRLVLNATASTRTGATILNSGTLFAIGSSTLGSGATTVNGGNLIASAVGGITTGSITVNNGGTLTVDNATSNLVFGDPPKAGNTLTINAGGTVTGVSAAAHLGPVIFNGGTLSGGSEPTFGKWIFDSEVSTTGAGTTSTISSTNIGLRQTGGVIFNVAGTDILNVSAGIVQQGNFSFSNKVIKSGSGTLALTGASVFTQGTIINAGTLVTGNTAALGGGDATVNGGVLQIGNGTVKTVTFASAKNLVIAGGTLKLDATLGTSTAAVTLSGGGKYTFNGTLDLSGVFNSAANGTYTLISGGTANVDTAVAIAGFTSTSGITFASFANGVLTIVPEPSTYGLLGAGTLAFASMIRRRRKVA